MNQMTLFDVIPSTGISASGIVGQIGELLNGTTLDERVELINEIRLGIHNLSPFKTEPVDLIQWVKADSVTANDYNPNSVAPPEMELLRHSINNDGYTQPVVTWNIDGGKEVIDGFHRTRVAKECEDVRLRVSGYLPVVTIKNENTGRNERISSTIRHNRARGKHKVDSMSDIVVELKKRNWSDSRISKELGMDQDEILRLCQVSGLTELFDNNDFSKSWDVGIFDEDALEAEFLTDDAIEVEADDSGRIYHTWEKWECHKAGFYENSAPRGMSKEEAEQEYSKLLSDSELFASILEKIIIEWKFSCEHYLSNENMNRIAWLGQAALAYELGIPACFRGGYNLLSDEQQEAADGVALVYLNKWLEANGREPVDAETVKSKTQANLY